MFIYLAPKFSITISPKWTENWKSQSYFLPFWRLFYFCNLHFIKTLKMYINLLCWMDIMSLIFQITMIIMIQSWENILNLNREKNYVIIKLDLTEFGLKKENSSWIELNLDSISRVKKDLDCIWIWKSPITYTPNNKDNLLNKLLFVSSI